MVDIRGHNLIGDQSQVRFFSTLSPRRDAAGQTHHYADSAGAAQYIRVNLWIYDLRINNWCAKVHFLQQNFKSNQDIGANWH